ncbi:hypothetical protein Y032_0007g3339 [Ancylostoma ceylanicum]|uniref:Cation efflux protein transmembrane domain-containing protein n=1 Tax=Ancylostoma ceylanicum TaxID=53326 RepID=A0A016VPH8_9BILA|nr:hypothetical protein Y032_0007g3339 [Ancylostoma ceylanicum]
MPPRRRKTSNNEPGSSTSNNVPETSNGHAVHYEPSETSPLQRRQKQEYYEQQSRLLQLYEKDRRLYESKEEQGGDEDREDGLLLHCCLALTIFSLIGNLIASILSGSLSILRLEYVGILICAILMAFANVAMAMQAFNNIADESSKPEMTFVTTVIVGVQTVLKGLLSWICYRRGSPSSIVVAMDLRNDVVTRISAVVFAYIGDEYWRLADPIGAILLW